MTPRYNLCAQKIYNLIISNELFVDNNIGVDLDRTEGVIVRDTVITGESASYRALMARQKVKADLHTWHLFQDHGGITIKNVKFAGFSNVACTKPYTIHMDNMVSFEQLLLHEWEE